jgi:hypothetical protein
VRAEVLRLGFRHRGCVWGGGQTSWTARGHHGLAPRIELDGQQRHGAEGVEDTARPEADLVVSQGLVEGLLVAVAEDGQRDRACSAPAPRVRRQLQRCARCVARGKAARLPSD